MGVHALALRMCVTAVHDLKYNANVLDLAEVLSQQGFDVDVYARYHNMAVHRGRGFRCLELPRASGDLGTALRFVGQTFGRYDVFVGMNATGLLLSLMARGLQGRGLCVYYALELEEPHHTLGVATIAARLRSLCLRSTDVIVTTGPERAEVLASWWPRLSRPVVLFNSPLREPARRSAPLRSLLQAKGVAFAANSHIILYHGALTDATAVDTMLEASSLWESNAHLVFMGFGDPILLKVVEIWAARERRVVSLPPVSEGRDALLEYVKDASIGIVLYRHTGAFGQDPNLVYATPNKLFDYMACGVPVVCSNNPSLRHVEREGWGACVDPDDPRAVACAVDRCILERSARSRIAVELFRSQYRFGHRAEVLSKQIHERIDRPYKVP